MAKRRRPRMAPSVGMTKATIAYLIDPENVDRLVRTKSKSELLRMLAHKRG